ncbi:LysR family transcriptional regulator [Yoonia sp. 2307UL14-13]|uniref:LysR family transcriptional regulator n=1 Tax=Yoonia sp. 2307UL14-13 TaxID=3126506 RepID=UPI0030B2FD2B
MSWGDCTCKAKNFWTILGYFWSINVTMKNIPLNLLRTFAAIYETGGIRPAARTLDVAHSAVSRALRELEAQLDVDLIERVEGRRILEFTEEGNRVGRAALKAIRELERTLESVRRIKGRASVVLETTPSFASRWLFPRLGAFEQDLPWIELSVSVDQRMSQPGQLRADLVLRMGQGPWNGFRCHPLLDDELIAVASPRYMKSVKGKLALSKCQLLHDRDPLASWTIWQDRYQELGGNLNEGPRYTSGDLVLRAAEQGLGVALSRRSLAAESLERGLIVDVADPKSVPLENSIWIVTPQDLPLRKPVQKVVDWLKEQVACQRHSR